ncbi:DUF4307 domain-containing protein [Kineococcus sp. SYSU DK003]|uniref:DUF4307 domain-containing protein n=1 Tax=Kineococcus sp. SYSU DK003 TaxID=3383124 RepID=UPI003D7D623F
MTDRQTPGEVPADVLAARYGRRPARVGRPWYRRPVPLAAAVLGALLVLAYGVWLAVDQSRGPAYTEISHRIVDDRTAEIRFSVTRGAGVAVRCQVHALDDGSAEVGLLQVDIPASDDTEVQESVQVRTTSRAVTVGVESCSAVEP